jgi:16S rRNA (uracil1498-N3)-methyltransferase
MRIPRIYTEQTLQSGHEVSLEPGPSHHLAKVLRMPVGAAITLFNGNGCEFAATLLEIGKKTVIAQIGHETAIERQSPLAIHLGIAMSKGDRMEWVIQKATELGVTAIIPLYSERCEIKLKGERAQKKWQQWQQISIGACEQSQRNRLPHIHLPTALDDWLAQCQAEQKYVLHHRTEQQLNAAEKPDSVALLIGPEGGLSEAEIAKAEQQGFKALCLGPRVLRTETAPLAAISIMQFLWGDF